MNGEEQCVERRAVGGSFSAGSRWPGRTRPVFTVLENGVTVGRARQGEEDMPPVRRGAVQPADLVIALTGFALLFFSFFVHSVIVWSTFAYSADVGPLGWVAPLVVGCLCVVTSVVCVAVRAIRPQPAGAGR